MAEPTSQRQALPRISVFLSPSEHTRLEAATADRLTLLARTTVHKICDDVVAGHADGVIISASMVRETDVSRLYSLIHELPPVPIIGLVSDGVSTTVAGTLLLGRAGIARVVDVRDRTGWGALRTTFSVQLPEQSARAALASILAVIEAKPDGTRAHCSDGLRTFFSAIFAPQTTTVLRMSAELGIRCSTITSRFVRAGLPSPKQYLALAKLVRAAYLGESPGLSLGAIAERLHVSSAQSYCRTVRQMIGLTAGEFRRTIHGPAMLDRFKEALVIPYQGVLQSFDPLRAKRPSISSPPSRQAA